MATKRILTIMLVAAATVWLGVSAGAQKGQSFKARLSPVPIEATSAPNITGRGSVAAVLTDTKLAITGTFEGLKTPATTAHLHRAQRGVRGPAVFELTVAKATSGAVSGAVALTPDQVGELKKGMFYVQIHSTGAPDGNLWGWLLP
jgi:hypothetical protein